MGLEATHDILQTDATRANPDGLALVVSTWADRFVLSKLRLEKRFI